MRPRRCFAHGAVYLVARWWPYAIVAACLLLFFAAGTVEAFLRGVFR